MWILLDVAVVLIVLLSIIAGYRKGFVKTSFKFGMLIAAFIIANSFSPMFSQYLQTTDVYESITNDIRSKISSGIVQNNVRDKQQNGSEPELYVILSELGFDVDSAVENYNNALKQSKEDAIKSLDKNIVIPFCRMLISAVSFVIVLVVSIVALKVLMWLLELVFKLPVLKTFNKSAGALAGVLVGLFKVFIFCVVIQLVLPYIPKNQLGFSSGVEQKTYIYKVIMDANPLSFIYK